MDYALLLVIGFSLGIVYLLLSNAMRSSLNIAIGSLAGAALFSFLVVAIYNNHVNSIVKPWSVSNTNEAVTITSPSNYGVPVLAYTKGTSETVTITFSEPLEPKGYTLALCPNSHSQCMTITNLTNTKTVTTYTVRDANQSVLHSKVSFRLISEMVKSEWLGIAIEYIDGKTLKWKLDLAGFKQAHKRLDSH